MWTHSPESGRCVRFFYNGCGATANVFVTEEQCKERCDNKEETATKRPQGDFLYYTNYCFIYVENRIGCLKRMFFNKYNKAVKSKKLPKSSLVLYILHAIIM